MSIKSTTREPPSVWKQGMFGVRGDQGSGGADCSAGSEMFEVSETDLNCTVPFTEATSKKQLAKLKCRLSFRQIK